MSVNCFRMYRNGCPVHGGGKNSFSHFQEVLLLRLNSAQRFGDKELKELQAYIESKYGRIELEHKFTEQFTMQTKGQFRPKGENL